MDGGDSTLSQSQDLIGSGIVGLGIVGLESRVDDFKLVGAPVGGVGEAMTVVNGGEKLVKSLPALDNLPAVAVPVVGQVIPVVEQVMDKRKRGRASRGFAPKVRPPKMMKEEDEDVCFICFDGGSLVLCDRKGCPKAYHPACIKRDEAFFRSKARWDCGWHICSVCQRASHYLCYTCTYSLCKKCTKDSEYVCVRGNKGFCAICMKTIMMIENNDAGNKESIEVDFDDKTSWEYLFKMYWILLKTKLSLTLNELVQAKNPCKGVIGTDFKPQLPEKDNSAEGGAGPILPKFGEHSEQKILQEQHRVPDQDSCSPEKCSSDKRKISDNLMDWASQELLDFVAHMRNGDTSVLSQFDVQAHLMEYIKKNNLRDPHQKSQIICDLRLKTLFGKPRVGHIEMLKLLEYHYLINEGTQKNAVIPAGIVGSGSHVAADSNNHSVLNQSKKQKNRKKSEERAPQVNLDEYAAIDSHNIKLIFLRRSMMENLLDQVEKFHDKVVGSIVRIRVSVNDQKQDIYRLVQVVGTSKGAEPYKIGDKTTYILLEVLNLDKKEMISIDAISNQEFSEDECRRLRQSIKCGLVKRFTVGEIQMKAMALQALRFDDWLVAEILRLSHLRDRANEKGHKKELRECVEKLQVLKTPEERHRKLTEIPEVHADPKMNPNYDSEEDAGENDKKQDEVSRRGRSKFSIIINQSLRPKKIVKEEDINAQRVEQKRDGGWSNCFPQQEDHASLGGSLSVGGNQSVLRSDSERAMVASVSRSSSLTSNIETEKMWHYRDPNGKIQGPFSMVQLQKWSTTGYFPAHMSIWTGNEQTNSIFLNDALSGQFHKNSVLFQTIFPEPPAAGIATENRLRVGDNLRNLGSTSEIRSNAVPEGLDYPTSDRSADATDKQKQSQNLQCSDLPINASEDSSGRPVMHNNSLHTYVDPLHQVPKHDTVEFSDAGRTEHSSMAAQHHSPGIESQEKSSRNQDYRPVVHKNNLHTYVDPLHQVPKHDTDEFSDAGRTEHSSKEAQHHSPGIESQEKSSRNQNYVCQSSGQNRPPVLNLDLNSGDCNTASVTNPSELSELKGDLDLVDLPSPTPKTGNRDLESQPNEQDSMFIDIQAAEMLRSLSAYVPTNGMTVSDVRRSTPNDEDPPISKPKPIDVEDLFNPEPKLTDENQVGQSAGPSEIAVIDIDCSNTSGQVAGGVQTQESAGVWITSPAHAEPSYKEWDFGLVPMSSLKPDEVVGDIGTSNSDSSRHHDSLSSHPLPNVSGWLGFHEPIEFSTLAEESVSDLLAEVDAMESQIGMPSPSSAMRCGDDMMDRNDCFSSIEELSPTTDAGKSDAVSSAPDVQFSSQPAENDDPVEASQVGDFNPLLKRSDVHSTTSSEGETKSANYPINIWESRSDIHPPAPCTMNQAMINATGHGWASVQGNMNLGWAGPPQAFAGPPQAFAGPPQAFADAGWRPPSLGTSWANANLSLGSYNGNAGWDSPHRFNGSRDWQFQGGDLGFGRGRPMWSRQQHGSGGGYSRPPSKGQRVCKFYESGHCKKGASCGYLHP